MPLIGGGLALSGVLGFAGSSKQSSAQNNAAQLQYQASQNAISAAQAQQAYAVQLSQATPTELGLINQQIATQTQAYNQAMQGIQADYQNLASATPMIQSAGQQALQLLNGQQAAILAPIQDQRTRQLLTLQNQLKAQLGSGYATSSVGQQALLQFNLQTQDLMTQAQNQTLQNLAGISLQGQGIGSKIASTQAGISSNFLSAPLQAVQNIQNRQVNAATGNQVQYGQLIQGSQGFMTAAQSAGNPLQQLSNTAATATSVLNSQQQTQTLANAFSSGTSNLGLSPFNYNGSNVQLAQPTIGSAFAQ